MAFKFYLARDANSLSVPERLKACTEAPDIYRLSGAGAAGDFRKRSYFVFRDSSHNCFVLCDLMSRICCVCGGVVNLRAVKGIVLAFKSIKWNCYYLQGRCFVPLLRIIHYVLILSYNMFFFPSRLRDIPKYYLWHILRGKCH